MIAMLNGLGNTGCRSCDNSMMTIVGRSAFAGLGEVTVSAAYADFSTKIAAATTEAELTSLKAAIDSAKVSGAVSLSEASALGVQIMERSEAIGPIHKRWWFYPALIGVGVVGWHFYKKSTTGRGII